MVEERDLALKITADGTPAVAAVGEVRDAVTNLTASETERAAASVQSSDVVLVDYAGQSKAVERVQNALTAAIAAMGEYANAAVKGGAAADVAFETARAAVVRLEDSTLAVKAIGGPVSAETVAILTAYSAALTEASAASDLAATSGTKVKTSVGLLRAEGAVASEAIGPLGRALTAMAGSGDGAAASLSRFLLPLAAAAGAVVALDKVLSGLNDRGLNVGSISKIASDAMDALAVALGGTTKATAEAIKAFEGAQKSVEGLDVATRSYKTGLDLVATSGLDVVTTVESLRKGLNEATPSFERLVAANQGVSKSTADAKDELNRFNTEINAVRIIAPELADKMVTEFTRLAKAAQDGTAASRKALADFLEANHGAAKGAEDFTKKLEETYGKEAPKAFGAFSGATQDVIQKFNDLRAGGLTIEEAFNKLKGQFDTSAAGLRSFSAVVAQLPAGPLKDAAAEVLKLTAALSGNQPVLAANERMLLSNNTAWAQIVAAIQSGTKSLGSEREAIIAVQGPIEKLVETIERQRDVITGGLQPAQQQLLDGLIALQKESGTYKTTLDSLTPAEQARAKQLRDLSVEIEKNAQSYRNHTDAIEKDRKSAVDAALATSTAIAGAVDKEIASLDRRRREGTLSETEFRDDVAKLQLDEVNARRKAQADADKINEAAALSQDNLKKDFDESSGKIVLKIGELNTSYESLNAARIALDSVNKDQIKSLEDESLAHTHAKAAVIKSTDAHNDLKSALKTTADDINKTHNPALEALHKAHSEKIAVSVPASTKFTSEFREQVRGVTNDAPAAIAQTNALAAAMNLYAAAAERAAAATAKLTGGGTGGDLTAPGPGGADGGAGGGEGDAA